MHEGNKTAWDDVDLTFLSQVEVSHRGIKIYFN